MSYREMSRRLEALEAADAARLERVGDRVINQLTESELDRYLALLDRVLADAPLAPTDEDRQVSRLIVALVQSDPEVRPGDLLDMPWLFEK